MNPSSIAIMLSASVAVLFLFQSFYLIKKESFGGNVIVLQLYSIIFLLLTTLQLLVYKL